MDILDKIIIDDDADLSIREARSCSELGVLIAWLEGAALCNKVEILRLLGVDIQDVNVSNKAICAFERRLGFCPSFECQELCDDIQDKIDGINADLGRTS